MKDSNNTLPVGAHDRESWTQSADTLDLRLWLRMQTCSTLVENHLRGLMRTMTAPVAA